MASTATRIVPDRPNKGHRPKRKPMSKAHRVAVAALAGWKDRAMLAATGDRRRSKSGGRVPAAGQPVVAGRELEHY